MDDGDAQEGKVLMVQTLLDLRLPIVIRHGRPRVDA